MWSGISSLSALLIYTLLIYSPYLRSLYILISESILFIYRPYLVSTLDPYISSLSILLSIPLCLSSLSILRIYPPYLPSLSIVRFYPPPPYLPSLSIFLIYPPYLHQGYILDKGEVYSEQCEVPLTATDEMVDIFSTLTPAGCKGNPYTSSEIHWLPLKYIAFTCFYV